MTQPPKPVIREYTEGLAILLRQEPHIRGLRLPYYRNFVPNAEIRFSFPITVLLGRNGTNKSSLLHALYGAPKNKSVSAFWFETHLDGIPRENEQGLKPSVVHSYIGAEGEEIHCIKARAPRDKAGNFDPDYWETVKPTVPYGFSESRERASPIELSVLHLDFRGLLPAFDRYFYFPSKQHLQQRKAQADATGKLRRQYRAQDYLRARTRGLREQLLKDGQKLSKVELEVLSYVLERRYVAGTLLRHDRFHGHDGWTFLFETEHLSQGYSEAFAGSGESAAAMLIHEVERADVGSLLLLDEPETSLHPRAQDRMMQFLVDRAGRKKLQIVIATHSVELSRKLPQSAIRVLRQNGLGKIEIDATLTATEALHETHTVPAGHTILVEDARAKDIVLAELEIQSTHAASEFQVVVREGGTSRIYSDIRAYAVANRHDVFVVFDGDQRPAIPIPEQGKLPRGLAPLRKLIGDLTRGNDTQGPQLDFASAEEAVAYIEFLRSRVLYLPSQTPEMLVWDSQAANTQLRTAIPKEVLSEQDAKKRMQLIADRIPGVKAHTVFELLLRAFLEGNSAERQTLAQIVRTIRQS